MTPAKGLALALLAYGVVVVELLSFETWALVTGHVSLSRAWWTIEQSPYGLLLPLLFGILAGHFVEVSARSIAAFLFGLVGAMFWHKVN